MEDLRSKLLVSLNEIEEKEADWLIPQRMPKGQIIILAGDGGRNRYRLILKGRVSPDNVLLTERLHGLGNIVEIMDESRPAYNIEELYRQYRGTLIGDYINKFLNKDLTIVEKKALYYGLQALLSTQVLADDRKRL